MPAAVPGMPAVVSFKLLNKLDQLVESWFGLRPIQPIQIVGPTIFAVDDLSLEAAGQHASDGERNCSL